MPASPRKPGPDLNLEGLRGVAAILVALSHLWAMGALMPKDFVPLWLRPLEAGHAAVLVFFVLSGYVIGLTNSAPPTPALIRAYVNRRVVRLLPIYWIALGFTACVVPAMTADRWFASLTLLQNNSDYFGWHPAPPISNTPIWSLHYEFVYYAAFLVLWRRPDWLGGSLVIALLSSLAGLCFPALPQFCVGWATGWLFWAGGWWLSQQPTAHESAPAAPLLTLILLLLAVHNLNSGILLAGFCHLRDYESWALVNFTDLAILPSCLLLVGGAARRTFPGARLCLLLAFFFSLGPTVVLLALGRLREFPNWAAGAILAVLSAVALPWRGAGWLRWFAPFGRVSYAFYLIHMPLLFLLVALGVKAASLAQLLVLGALWFALGTAVAAVLELWLQPRLRRAWLRQFPLPA